jgi:hypothetical protein
MGHDLVVVVPAEGLRDQVAGERGRAAVRELGTGRVVGAELLEVEGG